MRQKNSSAMKASADNARPTPKMKKALAKSMSLMLVCLAVVFDVSAKHFSALGIHGKVLTQCRGSPLSVSCITLKKYKWT